MTFITAALILLSACGGAEETGPSTATPPPPGTSTPVPTDTIVWFPATATLTPGRLAPRAPTPEQKPGIGALEASDDFSSGDFWDLASSSEGSAALSDQGLTLAVRPGIYLFRERSGLVVDNFYAELTASLSLCRDADEYGMLVRASSVAYYRFALTCSGLVRVDRVKGSSRQVLQSAVPSGDAPRGAPGQVRIGVWAYGSDLRFFLNGRYQFSVNDKNYASGTIGVFADSSSDTPVTVTFSDLAVYSLTYTPPTRTPQR